MTNELEQFQPRLDRVQRITLVVGGISLALCALLALLGLIGVQQTFQSYLFSYIYWFSIPLGCMALLMMHHLTGGWWGYPIRRLLEAGTRTCLVMAALFLPVLLGVNRLYPWAQWATDKPTDPSLHFKVMYLTRNFFVMRSVIYFAIWLTLVHFLNKWSAEQDATGNTRLASVLEAFSGPGLILWGIAVTYSAIDWVMSIEPLWFSTIYGFLFMIVEALVAMAFVIFVLRLLSDREPLKNIVTASQFNDLGNLMLAFVMLWAYLSFSQFLIIWAGNLKDEIPWYMARAFGGWGALAVFLMIMHFAVPFLLLLQRGVKRRLHVLSTVAGMLVVLTLVDVYWLIVPAFGSERKSPQFHFSDLFAVIGIGGIWVGTYIWQLKKMPLLPVHDPRFEGALQHEHGD
ncbi:MAG TPA: hypothetical protein VN881_13440 [Candidatus Acidoferrales bacterium]|jgi:hypothetical protein|nr:hypothetical protein [Candidatus Acidoferrales bacterium]